MVSFADSCGVYTEVEFKLERAAERSRTRKHLNRHRPRHSATSILHNKEPRADVGVIKEATLTHAPLSTIVVQEETPTTSGGTRGAKRSASKRSVAFDILSKTVNAKKNDVGVYSPEVSTSDDIALSSEPTSAQSTPEPDLRLSSELLGGEEDADLFEMLPLAACDLDPDICLVDLTVVKMAQENAPGPVGGETIFQKIMSRLANLAETGGVKSSSLEDQRQCPQALDNLKPFRKLVPQEDNRHSTKLCQQQYRAARAQAINYKDWEVLPAHPLASRSIVIAPGKTWNVVHEISLSS